MGDIKKQDFANRASYVISGMMLGDEEVSLDALANVLSWVSATDTRLYMLQNHQLRKELEESLNEFIVSGKAVSELCLVLSALFKYDNHTDMDFSILKLLKRALFPRVIRFVSGALCKSSTSNESKPRVSSEITSIYDFSRSSFQLKWRSRVSVIDCALLALVDISSVQSILFKMDDKLESDLVEDCISNSCQTFCSFVKHLRTEKEKDICFQTETQWAWQLMILSQILENYSSVNQWVGYFPDSFFIEIIETTSICLSHLAQGEVWVQSVLSSCLTIAANISHNNDSACKALHGDPLQKLYDMFCTVDKLQLSKSMTGTKACGRTIEFDFTLLLLSILTNLVERDETNRAQLGESGIDPIMNILIKCIPMDTLTTLNSENTGNLEFGWTAEFLTTSSHVCLLLGCLMRNNESNARSIQSLIPGKSVTLLVHVLKAFLSFQEDAGVLSEDIKKATMDMILEIRQIEAPSSVKCVPAKRPQDQNATTSKKRVKN